MPITLHLPPVSVDVAYIGKNVAKLRHTEADLTLRGASAGMASRSNLSMQLELHADAGATTCHAAACTRSSCVPCALGGLVRAVMADAKAPLDLTLRLGTAGALRLGVSLSTLDETQRDHEAAFSDRSRIQATNEALALQSPAASQGEAAQGDGAGDDGAGGNAIGQLVQSFEVDIAGTLQRSFGEFFDSQYDGKNLLVHLTAQLYGVFTVAAIATRVVFDVVLQVTGDAPRGAALL